jgi:hypothetical protein
LTEGKKLSDDESIEDAEIVFRDTEDIRCGLKCAPGITR